VRKLLGLLVASALYGFSIGAGHSLNFAARNLVKFPVMILTTGTVCAFAYYAFARFISRRLLFKDVQMLSLRVFHGIALLLASLSPVTLFIAMTMEQPDLESLREYPFFLGLNVVFIALCGCVVLVRQGWILLREYGLGLEKAVLILIVWLSLSLFVGGQCAWYLRPFCGISTIKAEQLPFLLGTTPDFRGDTNFYEAVYHILFPPPLDEDYFKEGDYTEELR